MPADPSTVSAAPPRVDVPGERHLLALAIAIPAIYALLLAVFWNRIGPRDFAEALTYHQMQFWNEQLFGLAKQWSPVICSGLSLAGEPQTPVLSLSMVLGYVLGPLAGLKLAALLYFICGWAGAYLYARLWMDNKRACALAASLFIGNGFFILRFAVGHVVFIPVLTLPMMLWLLHRSLVRPPDASTPAVALRTVLLTLLIAFGISVTIDGAPVSFLHLQFWIGLYALVLTLVTRTARPVLIFMAAAALAFVLDAGYVWPMVVAQGEFPRQVPDAFTNPLAFLWFLLLPLQGKLITPANGNGHELSVFIGPVIAYLIWRYRARLLDDLPRAMKIPLLTVSVVSLWLGMGSLHPLHVPTVLSPFDWLRPLPGFRSMGVTGRYWGFLALPLSLLGAAALHRFVADRPPPARLQTFLALALLLQLGFQTTAVLLDWLPSPHGNDARTETAFSRDGEAISFGYRGNRLQAELITPRHGIIDCYDMDDFRRAHMEPGADLVQSLTSASATIVHPSFLQARFMTWNRIRITADRSLPTTVGSGDEPAAIVLNQSYHRYWQSRSCRTGMSPQGNLALSCSATRLAHEAVELDFHDPISDLGAKVSATAWRVWLSVMAGLLALIGWQSAHQRRRHKQRSDVTAGN